MAVGAVDSAVGAVDLVEEAEALVVEVLVEAALVEEAWVEEALVGEDLVAVDLVEAVSAAVLSDSVEGSDSVVASEEASEGDSEVGSGEEVEVEAEEACFRSPELRLPKLFTKSTWEQQWTLTKWEEAAEAMAVAEMWLFCPSTFSTTVEAAVEDTVEVVSVAEAVSVAVVVSVVEVVLATGVGEEEDTVEQVGQPSTWSQ